LWMKQMSSSLDILGESTAFECDSAYIASEEQTCHKKVQPIMKRMVCVSQSKKHMLVGLPYMAN
ncbi:hypothetical protein, partial [Nocardioides malaquae]|uniref:hypothetical protein n=1 Tax=Nocardioides malaquae TaxID=2773426 RepID=UPI001D0D4F82